MYEKHKKKCEHVSSFIVIIAVNLNCDGSTKKGKNHNQRKTPTSNYSQFPRDT